MASRTSAQRAALPECRAKPLVVEGNRAEQVLDPGGAAELTRRAYKDFVRTPAGVTYRVLRSATELRGGELALKLPRAMRTDDEITLDALEWIGERELLAPSEVRESLEGAFALRGATAERPGLRLPQVGAVHSVLGYWTTGEPDPGTVVMPTGTGKTEAMLALFAEAEIERLLVVVPSDALRTQLTGKFLYYGVLQEIGVIARSARLPVVGQLRHRFTEAAAAARFCEACNVIVTTPHALLDTGPETLQAVVGSCSNLFVDEAHHVPAASWRRIRDAFGEKRVLQFTATPYRQDSQPLGGREVYRFPLKLAQEQGYFSHIDYKAVLDFRDPDRAIAREAVARLRADLASDLDHILMARVSTIERAEAVCAIYRELAPDLEPVAVHSRLNATHRNERTAAVRSGKSRVLVCVDMFGEGFDLPALKVCALHDPHKTLGVTLQFVGRFARTSTGAQGDAAVFAGRPEGQYDDRLRRLFAEDPDWNSIIRDLTEEEAEQARDVSEFERGFGVPPEVVSLRALTPAMSTVIYRTRSEDWRPDGVFDVHPPETVISTPLPLNRAARVLWFVVERVSPVAWGELPSLDQVTYELYVVYWDERAQLLYINSSNTDSHHEDLARAVAGADAKRITGEAVYRAMHNLRRLLPTNIGLLDVRNRNRRFTMLTGADVTEGLPEASAQTKTKTNIFASGFENGIKKTIGASLKGRIWSFMTAQNLKHWRDWCDEIGAKVANEAIPPEQVMSTFIRPQSLTELPLLVPLAIDWPSETWVGLGESRRLVWNGQEAALLDSELRIAEFKKGGPLRFDVVTPGWKTPYVASIVHGELHFEPLEGEVLVTRGRLDPIGLGEYLADRDPLFIFEDDAALYPPNLLLKPARDVEPFPADRLRVLDWDGVDLKRESQGHDRDQATVQARAARTLIEDEDWEVVLDDDRTGEIADLVALRIDGQDLIVKLVHCKFSSEADPGGRVEDLYEVCGQAQKSVRWRHYAEDMLARVTRRAQRRQQVYGYDPFEVGDPRALWRIEDQARLLRPTFTIAIAQPGLSRAKASPSQKHLLATTELYLDEVAAARFEVWCST